MNNRTSKKTTGTKASTRLAAFVPVILFVAIWGFNLYGFYVATGPRIA